MFTGNEVTAHAMFFKPINKHVTSGLAPPQSITQPLNSRTLNGDQHANRPTNISANCVIAYIIINRNASISINYIYLFIYLRHWTVNNNGVMTRVHIGLLITIWCVLQFIRGRITCWASH